MREHDVLATRGGDRAVGQYQRQIAAPCAAYHADHGIAAEADHIHRVGATTRQQHATQRVHTQGPWHAGQGDLSLHPFFEAIDDAQQLFVLDRHEQAVTAWCGRDRRDGITDVHFQRLGEIARADGNDFFVAAKEHPITNGAGGGAE